MTCFEYHHCDDNRQLVARLLGFSQGSNLCHPLAARCALGGSFGRMIVMVGVEIVHEMTWVLYQVGWYIHFSIFQFHWPRKDIYEKPSLLNLPAVQLLNSFLSDQSPFNYYEPPFSLGINHPFSDSLISCVCLTFIVRSPFFFKRQAAQAPSPVWCISVPPNRAGLRKIQSSLSIRLLESFYGLFRWGWLFGKRWDRCAKAMSSFNLVL